MSKTNIKKRKETSTGRAIQDILDGSHQPGKQEAKDIISDLLREHNAAMSSEEIKMREDIGALRTRSAPAAIRGGKKSRRRRRKSRRKRRKSRRKRRTKRRRKSSPRGSEHHWPQLVRPLGHCWGVGGYNKTTNILIIKLPSASLRSGPCGGVRF